MDPLPTLHSRLRAELSADFDVSKPICISQASGRLDVMGGVAHQTGSLACAAAMECSTAIAAQPRTDRELQVFSFNLFDQHQPFTFRMSLDRLAASPADQLRAGFAEPGRQWAGYVVGGPFLLHERKLINLTSPALRGMNLAIHSTIPIRAGIGSSPALAIAAMRNFIDQFSLHDQFDPMKLAQICYEVESRIVGTDCALADHVAICYSQAGSMTRMRCQPVFELLPSIRLPAGFQIVAIDSGVRSNDVAEENAQTRMAATIAHRMILEKMREFGRLAGKELIDDPMRGFLANLDPDDYKKFFRLYLPVVDENGYHVQQAADHHVLETRRVRQFCEFIEQAEALDPEDRSRYTLMDKAGHLMYASHLSYMNDAMLGSAECDLLVSLVKQAEKSGLYGARMTGRGCGGTVAVLAESGERSDSALTEIMTEYHRRTKFMPQRFNVTSQL